MLLWKIKRAMFCGICSTRTSVETEAKRKWKFRQNRTVPIAHNHYLFDMYLWWVGYTFSGFEFVIDRVAHFSAGKRETGNGNREISRREMGFFPGNFPVLAKMGLKWAKNDKNWPFWQENLTSFFSAHFASYLRP